MAYMPSYESDVTESAAQTGVIGGMSFSSRISIQKVCAFVGQFNDYKRRLVDQMGFQGMKQIHMLPKISLRFSAWIMQKIDVDSMRLLLPESLMLDLTEESVKNVFALPVGTKAVSQGSEHFSEAMAFYTEAANSHGQKGIHSLKAAEVYLLRPLTEESTVVEAGAFQIAFVIYVVGHILAPTCKHDYVCLDFLGSLAIPSAISEFNWCRYVLKHISIAARKLQADVAKGIPTINVGGCHLYLQIYYIDQLDLGDLNKPRGIYPRISLYDFESVRKIVEQIPVCQMMENPTHDPTTKIESKLPSCTERIAVLAPMSTPMQGSSTAQKAKSVYSHANGTTTPPMSTFLNPNELGPIQFSSHLKNKYPQHVGSKLPILLREHQARLVMFMNSFRRNYQEEMFRFADKIMGAMPDPCKCCNLPSKESCIVSNNLKPTGDPHDTPAMAKSEMFHTPVGMSATAELTSHCDGESSTAHSPLKPGGDARRSGSVHSRENCSDSNDERRTRLKKITQPNFSAEKTVILAGTTVSRSSMLRGITQPIFESDSRDTVASANLNPKGGHFGINNLLADGHPQADPMEDRITKWFYDIVSGLTYGSLEYTTEVNSVSFGLETDDRPAVQQVRPSRFAREPWSVGSFQPGPSPTAAYAIVDWITRAPSSTLARNWICHGVPRMLKLDGTVIRQQIIGSQPLSHDTCTLILRRLCQIECTVRKEHSGMQWRNYIEPDFSAYALANLDPNKLVSTHYKFKLDADALLVTSCRMYYLMAQLEEGWAAYGLDMQQRTIHVLDPVAGTAGFSNQRVQMHTVVSTRLATSFFKAINAFYDNWSCGTDDWKRRFPIIMTEEFQREDSGLCAIYLARHYDGQKLVKPLTKENFHMHRRVTLYEIMRLEGNTCKTPDDVLEAIKTSFHVL